MIGFLVDRIDDSYQNKLLGALVAAAEEVGAALVCFCAGPMNIRRGAAERHSAFHLAVPDHLDALLVSTPTLVSSLGHQELDLQLARFANVPIVSMGAELSGVASIVLDNSDAMRQITRHLIREHGCTRIACIRGPHRNTEAEERYQGYLAALAEAGIVLDDSLIVDGDFHTESGTDAVRVLLDERSLTFDALVACNDEMAVAAIHELQARGIRIPDEVKVTGFDDDIAAQYELPSLTTMRQRVTLLAREAVKLAVTGIGIDISTRRHLLRTELVVRRSCGCPLERDQFSVAAPQRPDHREAEPPLIQKRPDLCRAMIDAAPDLLSESDCDELLDGFFAGLMNKSVTAFVQSWDAVLRRAIQRDVELRLFQAVTTALRRGAVPPLIPFPGMLLRAETMLHEARVLLTNVVHQRATHWQLQEKRLTGKLCEVAQSLLVAGDLFQLAETLAPHLRELKIPGCCVAVYDPRHAADARNRVRIVLWYRSGESVLLDASSRYCYESELASARFVRVDAVTSSIVLPLYFGEKKLGIVIFEVGTRDGTVYEAIRAQISAALEATAASEDVRASERERDLLIEKAAVQLHRIKQALREPSAERATERVEDVNATEAGQTEASLDELTATLDALLDTRAQPNTLRAPSDAQQSGVAVTSAARKTGA